MKGGRTTPGEHRYCQGCLEKLRKIDRWEEKVRQLQAKLRRQERTAREGFPEQADRVERIGSIDLCPDVLKRQFPLESPSANLLSH